MDNYCHTCGNKGKEGGCPECGRRLNELRLTELTTMDVTLPVNVIPLQYQGKLWAPTVLSEGKLSHIEGSMLKLLEVYQRNKLPKFSLFLGRPAKSNKSLFAYSCLQTAIMAGYSAAPFLSTADWRRLYKASQINPLFKLYNEYRWDTLVQKDVVFLYVDHSDDKYTVISLLKDILDTRAGFNLATIIVSDYELASLVPAWKSDEYSLIYNPDPQRDMLRYPAVLQGFKE